MNLVRYAGSGFDNREGTASNGGPSGPIFLFGMNLRLLSFILIFGITFESSSQQISPEKWYSLAESNINLLPKYGNLQKTPEQVKADNDFLNRIDKSSIEC